MRISNKHFDRLQSGFVDIPAMKAEPGKVYTLTSQDKRKCSAICCLWVSPKEGFYISRFKLLK